MSSEHNPLASAQAELTRLLQQRAEIEEKIKALQETVKILEPVYANTLLLGYNGYTYGEGLGLADLLKSLNVDLGLTGSVKQLLNSRPNEKFKPTAIRDALVENKVSLPTINPMAAIHTTLKRLVDSSDRRFCYEHDSEGNTLYWFDPSMPVPEKKKRRRVSAKRKVRREAN